MRYTVFFPCSLFPIPRSAVPYSLLPTPYSLLPVPCSLKSRTKVPHQITNR
ncbi:hypothetical protein [Moorena sp. SIOASIH]|uniref:hypothetical protein n=1 Tax=Moorena sp. SIOASIH TaxID=2607817 RepID=UPI0025F05866|nr:hypothetical protein [Moorena sp. SIOASIH]